MFPPSVRTQLDALPSRYKTHATSRRSCPSASYCDRLAIQLNHCRSRVQWEILFDVASPEAPPDFVFPEQEGTPFVQLSQVHSLARWDACDVNALRNVVTELWKYFLEYHRNLVRSFPDERIAFEYNTTFKERDDIEFRVNMDVGKETICCLIPLKTEQLCHLMVVFHPFQEKMPPDTELIVPDALRDWFEGKKIPKLSVESCLVDYIPTVTMIVEEEIRAISLELSVRRSFFQGLIKLMGFPLESDTVSYRQAAFLIQMTSTVRLRSNTIIFVVYISLAKGFPVRPPLISLRSHDLERPLEKIYDTPHGWWDPRWPTQVMADRTRLFIKASASNFRDSVLATPQANPKS